LYKLNSNNKEVKKYAPQTMVNSPGGFLIQGDIKIGAQARILSDKDKNDLIKNLDKSKKILVSTIDSDSEAFKFATQILQFLKNQGYSATGIDRVSYTSSFVGVKVEAKETGDYEVRVGSL
jgi:hypothetical protein